MTIGMTGYLLDKAGWVHLRLPAIAEEDEQFGLANGDTVGRKAGEALHPARESIETLGALKRSIGAYDFAGQYQHDPAPRDGGLVRAELFPRQFSDTAHFDMIVQSRDTAHRVSTASASA